MVLAHTSHFPCEEHFNKGFVATLEYSGGRCQRAGRRGDLVGMAAMPGFDDTFSILKIDQNPFIFTFCHIWNIIQCYVIPQILIIN